MKRKRKRGQVRRKPKRKTSSVAALAVPNLWSKRLLLTKAQRYAEEMYRHERDDWRFAFWSTLSLELLARAALANVDPVLLADTRSDPWRHIYYALGRTPKTAKFVAKSIDISDVFRRLSEVTPTFEERLAGFCTLHLSRRNEELHSGGTPFDTITIDVWQPLYYEACTVLMRSMGSTLAALVGRNEAKTAAAMVKAANDKSAQAVKKAIAVHKTNWQSKSEAEREKLTAQAAVWATRQVGHRVRCPSCNSTSLVIGGPTSPPVVRLEEDWIVETQEFLPSRFECVACGLKITGLSHLHACGLGTPYKATSDYEPFEYYASKQPQDYYEADYNE
jgi:hypothetical protein